MPNKDGHKHVGVNVKEACSIEAVKRYLGKEMHVEGQDYIIINVTIPHGVTRILPEHLLVMRVELIINRCRKCGKGLLHTNVLCTKAILSDNPPGAYCYKCYIETHGASNDAAYHIHGI